MTKGPCAIEWSSMTAPVSPRDAMPTRSSRHQENSKRRTKRRPGSVIMGVIGELLITVGLFLALYVVWQLFWTSAEVQPQMVARIQQFQQENPTAQTSKDPVERTDAPPEVSQPDYGATFGVMHVPKWNWMQIPISEGTSSEILDLGNAGHYETTQLPGQVGNFAVAGHRRTYGNNFRRVDILEPGDPIVVETANAYLVYKVTSKEIVWPDQTSVLDPVPNQPGVAPTARIMTMTTCHPEFGNTQRYIVYSELAYWTDKAEGKPAILRDEPVR